MTAGVRINQLPPVPIMHWKKFAEVVGIEEGVLRGLCARDHIPSICFGKHRFINLARLQAMCLNDGGETVPQAAGDRPSPGKS